MAELSEQVKEVLAALHWSKAVSLPAPAWCGLHLGTAGSRYSRSAHTELIALHGVFNSWPATESHQVQVLIVMEEQHSRRNGITLAISSSFFSQSMPFRTQHGASLVCGDVIEMVLVTTLTSRAALSTSEASAASQFLPNDARVDLLWKNAGQGLDCLGQCSLAFPCVVRTPIDRLLSQS